jgi:hypothetical protein
MGKSKSNCYCPHSNNQMSLCVFSAVSALIRRCLAAAHDVYGGFDEWQSGHDYRHEPDSAAGVLPHRHFVAVDGESGEEVALPLNRRLA